MHDIVPGTNIHIGLEGKQWQIYTLDDEGNVDTIDCGIARTRAGAKWALIRRALPMSFRDKHQVIDVEAAKAAGPYAASDNDPIGN